MLPDEHFHVLYNSGVNEPLEFFSKAFLNSNHLDLGLGYFSSSAFRVLAPALAPFIYAGGTIHIAINDELSIKDKELLSSSATAGENIFEEKVLQDLESLFDHLASYDEHFLKCLAYLFQNNRIVLKAMEVTTAGFGIAHHKFGVFTDDSGNKIAFNGSANFSQNALLNHVESMTCFSSWTESELANQIIHEYSQLFEQIWTDSHPNLKIISLDKVKARIVGKFQTVTEDELRKSHKKLLQKLIQKNGARGITVESIVSRLGLEKEEKGNPHLPSFITHLHDYQLEAYENWKNNEYQGLFEMATGSGKTVTALYCALKIYEVYQYCRLLILVPSLTLLDQWEEEVNKFHFPRPVIISSKNKEWRREVTRLSARARLEKNSFCLISTYTSFGSEDFQNLMRKLPSDIIIIADEVHNFGTRRMINLHPQKIKYRIGLSATPARYFDEIGTSEIKDYFNSGEKPTISYTLKQAIEDDKLTKYYYYPYIVELTPDEMSKYIKITKQLYFYLNPGGDAYLEDKTVEELLLRRKRIIHKAYNKRAVLRDIIEAIIQKEGKLQFTLLYVPEGRAGTYDDDDRRLINEYSNILYNEYGVVQHQYIGETDNRQGVLQDFSKGKISVLTAMKCLDEGVDIKRTETAIFAASTGNPRQYIQRRGRILRKHPEKHISKIYDMLVIPAMPSLTEGDTNIEAKLIKNELKRIVEFADLAINTYESKNTVNKMIEEYNIDIYDEE